MSGLDSVFMGLEGLPLPQHMLHLHCTSIKGALKSLSDKASQFVVQDIQEIPGTSNPRLCMLSDEYSPALMVFNCDFNDAKCGEVGSALIKLLCSFAGTLGPP